MKRFLKFGLIGAAVLAVLWMVAAATLWLVFPPERVKKIVLERADSTLHRKVELESASIRVFPFLGVSLKGLSVANNPDSGFSKEPLARLASLDVELSFASILHFSPVVEKIVLDRPAIRAEVLADGRSSFDGIGGPADTAKPKSDSVKPLELPFPLTVRRIAIEGGSVTWLDRKTDRELAIGDIEQEISLETDKSLQNVVTKGTLQVKDISISGKGFPLRKGGIRFSISHDLVLNLPGANVEVKKLQAGLQDLSLTLSGKVGNVRSAPDLDLRLVSDGPIDLGKLLAEVPKELNPELAKLTLGGKLEVDLSAKGKSTPTSVPRIDGTIRLHGVDASSQGVPAKLTGLGTRIRILGTRTVEIDSTQWNLDGAACSLDLAVDSLPVKPHAKAVPVLRRFKAQGKIDLAAVGKVFAPMVPALDSLKPAGVLGWDIAGSGPLDPANPANLKAEGQLTFTKVSAKITGLPDRPEIDGWFKLSNATASSKLSVVAGPTDVSMDAQVTDWLAFVVPDLAAGRILTAKVSSHSRKIDLDRLLPPADTAKKTDAKPMTEFPDIPNVVVNASFDADALQAFGLSMTRVGGKADITKGSIAQSMGADVAKGRISQTLRADIRNRKAPGLQIGADLAGVEFHELLVAVKDRLPAGNIRDNHDKIFGRGTVKLVATSNAAIPDIGQKLSADLTGSLVDGKIASFPLVSRLSGKAHDLFPPVPQVGDLVFQKMAGQILLRDGRVELKDIAIDGSNLGALAVAGSIGVDKTLSMNVDTHLPQAASAGLQSGASSALAASGPIASKLGLSAGSPLPQDEQKRVVVSWIIGGSVNDPSVTPDLPRISTLVKGAVGLLAMEAKAKAEAEAKAAANKLKAEADARIQAEKAKVQKEVDAQKNKAVDQVKSKVKDVFKKPW